MQTLREQGLREKAIISSYTLTKGESWTLLRKSAVESTTLAQPFCLNQAVGLGDLSQRLHEQFVVLRQFSHGRRYQALRQCQWNVSSTKSDSYQLFTIIGHWDTRWGKKWRHFRKAAFSFSGWI